MAAETFLREQFEPFQYIAFFGVLAIFAVAELVIPLRREGAERRQRWPANYILTALNIAIMSAIPVSGLFAADWAATQGIGLIPALGLAVPFAVIAGILFRSLGNYAVHYAMHRIPLLWRLHRVHHSDAGFDVSTAVRFHPLEFAVQIPVSLALIVLAGVPPLAIILYELADAAFAVWTHANVKLPAKLERALAYVIVTPSMHRVHHSSYQPETDSNYGATLSIWDRLFGTLRERDRAALAGLETGLAECRDKRSRSLPWLLKSPFLRRLAPPRGERPS
jgi:sterol desaturase/sphingolipid hydroxylase (fatty acid hydroxylase superfamily)